MVQLEHTIPATTFPFSPAFEHACFLLGGRVRWSRFRATTVNPPPTPRSAPGLHRERTYPVTEPLPRDACPLTPPIRATTPITSHRHLRRRRPSYFYHRHHDSRDIIVFTMDTATSTAFYDRHDDARPSHHHFLPRTRHSKTKRMNSSAAEARVRCTVAAPTARRRLPRRRPKVP